MTKEAGVIAAAQKIHERLWRFQQDKVPTLLLVSGGSALGILEKIEPSVLDTFLTISVLDERFSADPTINNFAQLMNTKLYRDAVVAGCSFIDTRPQWNEEIDKLASRFESTLKNWVTTNPGGKIVITQGIGTDGHTAGILPFPENKELFGQLFDQPDAWVVSYDAGNKNQYPLRVTVTLPFLRMVDESILFVFGEEKKTALELINSNTSTLEVTPANIVSQMKKIWVFSDLTASFQNT